jgi:hypothetical protein
MAASSSKEAPEIVSPNYMDEVSSARRISKANWIRMVVSDESHGQCVQLTVAHMVGEVAKELHSVKLNAASPIDPEAVAKMFDERAAWYCQELPGAQTFNLIAFYGEGASTWQTSLPFQKTGAGNAIGLLTEPPDERGKTQMTMRHVEGLASGYFRGHQIALETLSSIIREQRQDNRDMRRDLSEAWGVVRQIMLDTEESRHKHRMEELAFVRSSEDRKVLFRMLPGMVNEAVGKEIIPQSTVDSAMIDMVVENMTPEQLKLAVDSGAIPAPVGAFLAKRMMEKEKARAKSEQADKNARELTTRMVSSDPQVKAEDEVG